MTEFGSKIQRWRLVRWRRPWSFSSTADEETLQVHPWPPLTPPVLPLWYCSWWDLRSKPKPENTQWRTLCSESLQLHHQRQGFDAPRDRSVLAASIRHIQTLTTEYYRRSSHGRASANCSIYHRAGKQRQHKTHNATLALYSGDNCLRCVFMCSIT